MMQIRALQRDDNFGDVIALSREFFAEYEDHHEDFFKIDQLHDSDITDYFTRWIDTEIGETFIALSDDRIVGYITVYVQDQAPYWKIKRVGNISGLMVHKEFRRRGIAAKLIAQAREFFAGHGVRYFTAYTSVENKTALAFYEHLGIVPLQTTVIGESGAAVDS